MNNSSFDVADENIRRFWDNYLILLRKKEVKTSCERWYVYQSEQYINAHPDLRLVRHSPEHIACYLKQLGQNSSISDWQYRQAVHAIQILFSLINAPWIHEVDWSFWLKSSFSLKLNTDYLTLTHESTDISTPASAMHTIDRKLNNHKQTKQKHEALLIRFLTEVRRRAYSIRTEQVYLEWIVPFLTYFDNEPFDTLDSKHITLYLEHLAVHRNVIPSTQNQALNALLFLFPTGIRLMECIRLRVMDIDFDYQPPIRDGKG